MGWWGWSLLTTREKVCERVFVRGKENVYFLFCFFGVIEAGFLSTTVVIVPYL